MIKHLFKLIWNKKKQNFLLMLEMLFSFIVMFAVFTLVVYYYQNYSRPRGFDYEDVWSIKYNDPDGMKNADSIAAFNDYIRQTIKAMPQVEDVSISNINVPFGDASMGTYVTYGKAASETEQYRVDDNYKSVLGISLTEGRWFSKEDAVAKNRNVIINETLRNALFGDGKGVGKLLELEVPFAGAQKMKIVGVINDLKDKGDFSNTLGGIYLREDTSNQGDYGALLIKVKPGTTALFEAQLFKELSNAIPGTSIDILHLDNERQKKITQALGPMIVLMVVAGFLIINVALGLFGVLWYNINKRKSEIGLRRAVGASSGGISKQLIGEAMVLSTISLIVGSFFAVQFPLLNVFNIAASSYLIALVLAIMFIYVLVIACAFYPGKQAAAIYPAEALHED